MDPNIKVKQEPESSGEEEGCKRIDLVYPKLEDPLLKPLYEIPFEAFKDLPIGVEPCKSLRRYYNQTATKVKVEIKEEDPCWTPDRGYIIEEIDPENMRVTRSSTTRRVRKEQEDYLVSKGKRLKIAEKQNCTITSYDYCSDGNDDKAFSD